MTGFRFARACRSIAEDGSILEDDTELPVGAGRQVECTTFELTQLQAADVLASTGEPWCALGQLESYRGHGGEEITIRRLSGLGNWPLWAEIHYDVIDLRPNPDFSICEQIFGL